MCIGKLILRTQRFELPAPIKPDGPDISVEFMIRLFNGFRENPKAMAILKATGEEIIVAFFERFKGNLTAAMESLQSLIQPFMQGMQEFIAKIETGDAEEITLYLMELISDILDLLTAEKIRAALNSLFDVVENHLNDMIENMVDEVIRSIFDGIIEKLAEAFRNGDTGKEAFGCFLLSKQVEVLRDFLLDLDLPDFDLNREKVIDPVVRWVEKSNLEDWIAIFKQVIDATVDLGDGISNLVDAISSLEVNLNVSVEVDVEIDASVGARSFTAPRSAPHPGEEFARARSASPSAATEPGIKLKYLWYASWITGEHMWLKEGWIYTDSHDPEVLKVLGSNLELNLELEAPSGPLFRAAFLQIDEDFSEEIEISKKVAGELWHVFDKGEDNWYTVRKMEGELRVFKERIYKTGDWTQIEPLKNYTFKNVEPDTCEEIAFYSSFFVNLVKGILHLSSMDATSDIGPNSDMFSNLAQGILNWTYMIVKTRGPSGAGSWEEDVPLENFWIKWGLPNGLIWLTSPEGIHTEEDNPCEVKTIFWLTLLGADLSEEYLYAYWTNMARGAVISFVTLYNYEGPTDAPSVGEDNRPDNRLASFGFVQPFIDAGSWIHSAIFPQWLYGIPNDTNGDFWWTIIGHWFGLSAASGFLSGTVGYCFSLGVSHARDGSAFWEMTWKSWVIPMAKFWHYLYLVQDGDTNGGTYTATNLGGGEFEDANPFPGYGNASTSPYLLPYERGETSSAAQGHHGLWSHTPHSFSSQIYGVDFAMDFGDEILAFRNGVVWNFTDTNPDSEDAQNIIRVAHPATAANPLIPEHDFDINGNTVPTFGIYVHGAQGSVTELITPHTGINLPTGVLVGNLTLVTRAANSGIMSGANIRAEFTNVGIDLSVLGGTQIAVWIDNTGGTPIAVSPVVVSQGQPIMRAGDTGRSAYNHLHIHVVPATVTPGVVPIVPTGMALYTIPYVYREISNTIGPDGVPKALKYYTSQNERVTG